MFERWNGGCLRFLLYTQRAKKYLQPVRISILSMKNGRLEKCLQAVKPQ